MASSTKLLFAGTLTGSRKAGDASTAAIKFRHQAEITEVRIIPKGFYAPIKGIELVGETSPKLFQLQVFADTEKQSSRFTEFASFDYDSLTKFRVLATASEKRRTSTMLVLVGPWDTITVCVYGVSERPPRPLVKNSPADPHEEAKKRKREERFSVQTSSKDERSSDLAQKRIRVDTPPGVVQSNLNARATGTDHDSQVISQTTTTTTTADDHAANNKRTSNSKNYTSPRSGNEARSRTPSSTDTQKSKRRTSMTVSPSTSVHRDSHDSRLAKSPADAPRGSSQDSKRSRESVEIDSEIERVKEFFLPAHPTPGECTYFGIPIEQPIFTWCTASVGWRMLAEREGRYLHHLLPVNDRELGRKSAASLKTSGQKLYSLFQRQEFAVLAQAGEAIRSDWVIAMEETLPDLRFGLFSLVNENSYVISQRLIDWTLAALDTSGAARLGKSMNLRQLKIGILFAKTIWSTSSVLGDKLTRGGAQKLLWSVCQDHDMCSTVHTGVVTALDASLDTVFGLESYLGFASVDCKPYLEEVNCSSVSGLLSRKNANVRMIVAIEKLILKLQLYETLIELQQACDRLIEENESADSVGAVLTAIKLTEQHVTGCHELWQKGPNSFPDEKIGSNKIKHESTVNLIVPSFIIAALSGRCTLRCFAIALARINDSNAQRQLLLSILTVLMFLMRSKAGILLLRKDRAAADVIVQLLTTSWENRLETYYSFECCLRRVHEIETIYDDDLDTLKASVAWLVSSHIEATDIVFPLLATKCDFTNESGRLTQVLQLLLTWKFVSGQSTAKQGCTRVAILFGALPWLINFLTAPLPEVVDESTEINESNSVRSKQKVPEIQANDTVSMKIVVARRWAISTILALTQDGSSTPTIVEYGVKLSNLKVKLKRLYGTDTEIMNCLTELQTWMAPVTSISKLKVDQNPLMRVAEQISSVGINPTDSDYAKVPALLIATRLLSYLIETSGEIDICMAVLHVGTSVACSVNFIGKLLDRVMVTAPQQISVLLVSAQALMPLADYVIRVSSQSNTAVGDFKQFLSGFVSLYRSVEQIAGDSLDASVVSAAPLQLRVRAADLLFVMANLFAKIVVPHVDGVGVEFDTQIYKQAFSVPALSEALTFATASASNCTGSLQLLHYSLKVSRFHHEGSEISEQDKWKADFLDSVISESGTQLAAMINDLTSSVNPSIRESVREIFQIVSHCSPTVGVYIMRICMKEAIRHVETALKREDVFRGKKSKGNTTSQKQVPKPQLQQEYQPVDAVKCMSDVDFLQLRSYLDLVLFFLPNDCFFSCCLKTDGIFQFLRSCLDKDSDIAMVALTVYWQIFQQMSESRIDSGMILDLRAQILEDVFKSTFNSSVEGRCLALQIVLQLIEENNSLIQELILLADKHSDMMVKCLMAALNAFTNDNGNEELALLNCSSALLFTFSIFRYYPDMDYTRTKARTHADMCTAIRKSVELDASAHGIYSALASIIETTASESKYEIDAARIASLARDQLDILSSSETLQADVIEQLGALNTLIDKIWKIVGKELERPVLVGEVNMTLNVEELARKFCPSAIPRHKISHGKTRGSAALQASGQSKRQYKKLEGKGISLGMEFRSARDGGKIDQYRTMKSITQDSRAPSMHVDDFMKLDVFKPQPNDKLRGVYPPRQNQSSDQGRQGPQTVRLVMPRNSHPPRFTPTGQSQRRSLPLPMNRSSTNFYSGRGDGRGRRGNWSGRGSGRGRR